GCRRWRVQDGWPEPRIERMTAAVPGRHRRLSLALAIVWTDEADVKMFGMSPPRPHLGEPTPVISGLAAHLLLDRGVHENARDAWVFGGSLHNLPVGRRPHFVIDIEPIRRNDVHGRVHFAFFARQRVIGHRFAPDVDFAPDLVAGVPVDHWSAPRLRHVADQKTVPADLFGIFS